VPDRLAAAMDGGCRIKPSEKMRGALAEVHSRADVRDDLAMDRPLATDKGPQLGACPAFVGSSGTLAAGVRPASGDEAAADRQVRERIPVSSRAAGPQESERLRAARDSVSPFVDGECGILDPDLWAATCPRDGPPCRAPVSSLRSPGRFGMRDPLAHCARDKVAMA
jgi:hypothetical protein